MSDLIVTVSPLLKVDMVSYDSFVMSYTEAPLEVMISGDSVTASPASTSFLTRKIKRTAIAVINNGLICFLREQWKSTVFLEKVCVFIFFSFNFCIWRLFCQRYRHESYQSYVQQYPDRTEFPHVYEARLKFYLFQDGFDSICYLTLHHKSLQYR